MSIGKFVGFTFIVSVLSTSSWSARAQDPQKSVSQQAREHFQRGRIAYSQGDHELAIKEWETAYSIDPRPKIKYNLAQAYERLGKLSEASKALEQYLEKAGPEDSEYLADARAALASIQARLSRTGVVLRGGLEGASIFVDGQPWGRTPRPDKIGLSPGSHRVTVKQSGFRDFISDISVPAGQVVEIEISLEPTTGMPAGNPTASTAASEATTQVRPNEAAVPPSPSDGANRGLAWFITAGVLGGAAVGGAVWTITRFGALDDCQNPSRTKACLNESALKNERTAALVTTLVFGAGSIAAAVIGVIQSAGTSQEQSTATACSPSLQGLTCFISF